MDAVRQRAEGGKVRGLVEEWLREGERGVIVVSEARRVEWYTMWRRDAATTADGTPSLRSLPMLWATGGVPVTPFLGPCLYLPKWLKPQGVLGTVPR